MALTPTQGLDAIMRESKRVIQEEAYRLKADLVLAAPVETGQFKAAWTINKISDLHWQIVNRMEYASILWAGRRTVGGKAYGSEQWIQGGDPMLKKTDITINTRTRGIRA